MHMLGKFLSLAVVAVALLTATWIGLILLGIACLYAFGATLALAFRRPPTNPRFIDLGRTEWRHVG